MTSEQEIIAAAAALKATTAELQAVEERLANLRTEIKSVEESAHTLREARVAAIESLIRLAAPSS